MPQNIPMLVLGEEQGAGKGLRGKKVSKKEGLWQGRQDTGQAVTALISWRCGILSPTSSSKPAYSKMYLLTEKIQKKGNGGAAPQRAPLVPCRWKVTGN